MIQGSTGGSGLRAVEKEKPDKVQASVLYLDRESHKLQAWDEITLGGLGLSKAEVSRHLPQDVKDHLPTTTPTPSSPPTSTPSSSSAPPSSPPSPPSSTPAPSPGGE